MQLSVAGCLSEDQNRLLAVIVEWLAGRMGLSVEESDVGGADLVYQCGLPTGEQIDQWLPLVAPVMSAPRYIDQPIYWSDVIVRPGTNAASLTDLAGSRIAYNHQESFSGWVALQLELRRLGISPELYTWIETGAHLHSIAAVDSGQADLAAIDSMVLALSGWEGMVVASLGPRPAPPLSLRRHRHHLAPGLIEALTAMHTDLEAGRRLAGFGVARLAPVEAESYRHLARLTASLRAA